MSTRSSPFRLSTSLLLLVALVMLLTQLGCVCTLLGTAFTTPPFLSGDRVVATKDCSLFEGPTFLRSKVSCDIHEGERGTVLGIHYNVNELTTFVEVDMDFEGCEGNTVFTNFQIFDGE